MITITNLHKSFGVHDILKGIDLDLPKGKISYILGPSGGGKSVLLRHMIGLLNPDRGHVFVNDVDIHSLSGQDLTHFRKQFGMLFQNAALFDSLTVFENVAFPIVEHNRGKKIPDLTEQVEKNLSLVGLSGINDKLPSELSGGMRKRVGLARAIALRPEIILYDEPTTGLDPVMTRSIDNLILSMQQELDVTSIVISHDMDSACRVADFIAMIYQGKIIESGSSNEFFKSKSDIVQQFINAREISGGMT